MFNLISKLTEQDRQKIENYIRVFGVDNDFIGLDEWLKYWGREKIKLYKLLGNNLIYKIPFEYEKPQDELQLELYNLIQHNKAMREEVFNYIRKENLGYQLKYKIEDIFTPATLRKNKTNFKIQFKLPSASKELQLQEGTKPIKAITKIINYFNNVESNDELLKMLEKFKKEYSLIAGKKFVKGNLVFSIHPLDFMTSSDNSLNWHSCLSWEDDGLYQIGTVEMMNSNNVLCCYLEAERPYYFFDEEEAYSWNNKKFRQYLYVTKDIIVSGKAYPFSFDKLSKTLVKEVRELAHKNLHWDYEYGIEKYCDMKHVTGNKSMNRIKNNIAAKDAYKKAIIFDTKGMYNDMLADNSVNYFCVRNKVNSTKVISYSGKAPCLRCGKPVITYLDDTETYHERYENTNSLVCSECLERKYSCTMCGTHYRGLKLYKFIDIDGEWNVCSYCASQHGRICSDCGKPLYVRNGYEIIYDDGVSITDYYLHLFCAKKYGIKRDNIGNWWVLDKPLDKEKYAFKNLKKCNFDIEDPVFLDMWLNEEPPAA
jgi:DNA-directed RNA polymerase subunit RPC12/RpoP